MNPTAKLFALFSALALLFPACVTVRDCDGNRYRTLKINGMRWMAEILFGKVYNGYSVRCVQDGAKVTTPKLKVKKQK